MVWSVQAPPHHAKSIHSFFSSTIMKVWSLVVTILYSSLRADAAVLDDRYGSAVATEQLQSSRDTTLGEHSLEDCTFQAFSGDWCDGDAGPLEAVSGDSSCFVATDRHSYRIGTGCPRLWYNYYEGEDCVPAAYAGYNHGAGDLPGGCINVNTRRSWRSTKVAN